MRKKILGVAIALLLVFSLSLIVYASGLNEWKSFIENNTVYVKLDSASSDRGSLKKGETYTLKYSKVGNTENFEVTGTVSYSGNTLTTTYSNAKLQDYQLSLWGRKYRFDANGNVWDIHLAQEELAGKLLRSKTASKRFDLVMGGNAVLDNETGLVWAKDANIGGKKTWQNAINYCADLSISDQKGWRLPEKEELVSLLDMSVSGSPKLPEGHPFINVQSQYWSSTTCASAPYNAWVVVMSDGHVASCVKGIGYQYVWPVSSDN